MADAGTILVVVDCSPPPACASRQAHKARDSGGAGPRLSIDKVRFEVLVFRWRQEWILRVDWRLYMQL